MRVMVLRTEERSGNVLKIKIAVNQTATLKRVFRRPSNHHAGAQRPGQPTPPFTLWDTECPWEGHNRSIILWPSTLDALKTAVLCSPIEVDGCWASTGKCNVTLREWERVSRSAISSWFWTNSSRKVFEMDVFWQFFCQWNVNTTVYIWQFNCWNCRGSSPCSLREIATGLNWLISTESLSFGINIPPALRHALGIQLFWLVSIRILKHPAHSYTNGRALH